MGAKIEQWFQRFGQEPCVVRTGGKPLIFNYGASGLQPAQSLSSNQTSRRDSDGES